MTDLLTPAGAGSALTPPPRWRLTPGIEVLGPVQGSGLRDPAYLVRRGDGQMLQLSELLHLVLSCIDPSRDADAVAAAVTAAYGRTLTVEGLEHLVSQKLQPLGLVTDAPEGDDDGQLTPKANPLLALTIKGTLLPPSVTRPLARGLQVLYWPPAVLLSVVAMIGLNVLVVQAADFWLAVTQLFTTPTLALAMYGLLTLSAVIHELGHAAACRYGGAQPGAIGVGLYIIFPAFYTDVTDSYRLGRGGRIRTDLGGLYFNVFCVLALGLAYLGTGHGVFLLTWVILQVQMLQQLIPVVRFDGYYVLSDLAGVPDLFARVGPVLRTLRPGVPADPRVTELRPGARRMVVTWVVLVVPTLMLGLVWLIWRLPEFVSRGGDGIRLHRQIFDAAWAQRDVAMMGLSTLSMLLILLPLLGVAVLLWRALAALGRWVQHRSTRPGVESWEAPAGGARHLTPPEIAVPSAADFTDALMLPARRPAPGHGWRRAVYTGTGHVLNPGRSQAELHREALERRLRTPIEGSRRVVVMSRKGGVGKTTISLALGSTFAMLRGDRVVAVDANPDAGNLAHRAALPMGRTITDVLRDLDRITTYAELRSYTSQAEESRLEVLASDDDPRIGMALDRTDYHRLIDLLDHYYNLILLDTGTGILDSANQGLLSEADQVVLVLRQGIDGGRAAALTLDWMDEHGFAHLVANAVVVINGLRDDVGAPADPMRRHFEKRCDRVITVPWDPALETGGRTDMSSLRRQTRDSMIQVAAAVADNFREMGTTR
ncbi:nucleotide-binding protein [Nocardioides donggukensis]|uniref:AAA family ATPase n=1 Tax=Nocardioides donggukensis TaxID=2774019 RepID=A0A927K2S7_9ACTN|nr:AAA family ATPase [Nocardioides donggukensis]MBD8868837.1 AAA family ATPase [Nocardioides donggukensis]